MCRNSRSCLDMCHQALHAASRLGRAFPGIIGTSGRPQNPDKTCVFLRSADFCLGISQVVIYASVVLQKDNLDFKSDGMSHPTAEFDGCRGTREQSVAGELNMPAAVRDLMSACPATVHEDATLQEALSRCLRQAASDVYVTDAFGKLIGVVPDYELLKARLAGISEDTLVAKFMSTSVPTTTPEALVSEIIPRFRDCRHRWIAVVESGKLVGQIGRIDVLRLVAAGNEAEMPVTSTLIKAPQFARSAVRSLSGMLS